MSYSFDIKLKAVKMYLEEGIGSPTIARELNLRSNKRVLLWMKKYNEFGEYGLRECIGTTRGLQKGRPRKRELSLEEENQRLKEEIQLAVGRYGQYIKCGKNNYRIPNALRGGEITLDDAIKVIDNGK